VLAADPAKGTIAHAAICKVAYILAIAPIETRIGFAWVIFLERCLFTKFPVSILFSSNWKKNKMSRFGPKDLQVNSKPGNYSITMAFECATKVCQVFTRRSEPAWPQSTAKIPFVQFTIQIYFTLFAEKVLLANTVLDVLELDQNAGILTLFRLLLCKKKLKMIRK
jgi:hypothetical protein